MKRNRLKNFIVGLGLFVAVLVALVLAAAVNVAVMHTVWVPLLGGSAADSMLMIMSAFSGGLVMLAAIRLWGDRG